MLSPLVGEAPVFSGAKACALRAQPAGVLIRDPPDELALLVKMGLEPEPRGVSPSFLPLLLPLDEKIVIFAVCVSLTIFELSTKILRLYVTKISVSKLSNPKVFLYSEK